MSTQNETSSITSHSVTWRHMIYQLAGIKLSDTKPLVELLLPEGTIVRESTFHYANSTK